MTLVFYGEHNIRFIIFCFLFALWVKLAVFRQSLILKAQHVLNPVVDYQQPIFPVEAVVQ